MAWNAGDAQGDEVPCCNLKAKIIVNARVVAECMMEFDNAHNATEIKLAMLRNPRLGGPKVFLPDVMRNHLRDCVLVFCHQHTGTRSTMTDANTLSDFKQYLNGCEAWLELHEPGADIRDDHPPDLLDFGAHQKKGH